jgi:hypothetical protein
MAMHLLGHAAKAIFIDLNGMQCRYGAILLLIGAGIMAVGVLIGPD